MKAVSISFALLMGLQLGCQTRMGGMTLPSPQYLQHYPQYHPPEPAFPLQRERDAMFENSSPKLASSGMSGRAEVGVRPTSLTPSSQKIHDWAPTTPEQLKQKPQPKREPVSVSPTEKPNRPSLLARFIGLFGK